MWNATKVLISAPIYQGKRNIFCKSCLGQKRFFTVQICGKKFSAVSKRLWCLWVLILSLTSRVDDDERGMHSRPERCFQLKGSEFLLWMNYMTLVRLKQLFSPVLYIYGDTWKAAVINHIGFHIPCRTTRLLRFWTSVAPCEVLPSTIAKAVNAKSLNIWTVNNNEAQL